MAEDGYVGLSMERVAQRVEYSKGTIYLHFACKEDLLAAMVLRTMRARIELWQRAAMFEGRTRERIVAMIELDERFFGIYPDHIRQMQVTRVSSILTKAAAERQQALRMAETRLMAIIAGILRDAVARDDLVLTHGRTAEEMAFGLLALVVGARSLIHSDIPLENLGIRVPASSLLQSLDDLLDGLGWRPLSNEWDYGETRKKIHDLKLPA